MTRNAFFLKEIQMAATKVANGSAAKNQKTEVLMSIPPNQTLYLRGLNEKTSKQQLRHLLYCLFSQFGKVLDVVAMKTLKMRGQAFVVYGRIEEATLAMRSLQGLPFLDRPLVSVLIYRLADLSCSNTNVTGKSEN